MKRINKEFTPDFLNIPYVVMDMQPADRFVFGAIYMFSQLSQKRCIASNVALGKIAKVRPESVSNSLIKLEERGFIKRYFKDNNKRTRDYIECLVGYVKIPSSNGIDTISRLDVIPSTDEHIKNIDKDIYNIQTSELFNSKEYLENIMKGSNKLHSIVAVFALFKKKVFKDKKSANAFIFSGFNLKCAKELIEFDNKDILKAMKKCDEYIINGCKVDWSLRAVVGAINK